MKHIKFENEEMQPRDVIFFPKLTHSQLHNGKARLTAENKSVDNAPHSICHYFGHYPILRTKYLFYPNEIGFIDWQEPGILQGWRLDVFGFSGLTHSLFSY